MSPQYFGFTFLLNGLGLIVFSQGAARWLHHRPAELLFFACLVQTCRHRAGAGLRPAGWGGLFGLLPWTFVYCSP